MDVNNIESYLNNKFIIGGLIIIILLAGVAGFIVLTDSSIQSPDENFNNNKSLNGDVYVNNEPVSNASVELYKSDGLVNSTETDGNGSFRFGSESGLISVSINGEHVIGGTPYHSGDYRFVNESEGNVSFNFFTEDAEVVRINGTNRVLDYEGGSEGEATDKVISDVYMLQGIEVNKTTDYELTRNIDANPTSKWYKYNDTVKIKTTENIMKSAEGNWREKIGISSFYELGEEVSNEQNVDYSRSEEKSDIIADFGSNAESYQYPVLLEFEPRNTVYNGFRPIGDSKEPLTGDIDGNGFEIKNLHIDRAEEYVSVIGYNKGNITNIGVNHSNITGNHYVGGVTGYNNGTVSKSYAITSHNLDRSRHTAGRVGGITGQNEGVIDTVYADFTSNLYNGHGRAAAISSKSRKGSIDDAYFRSNGEYEYEATTEPHTIRFDTVKIESFTDLQRFDYENTWYRSDEYSKLKIKPAFND